MAGAETGELAAALRSAREQHRAGAGSVLDVLLRMPGWTVQRLALELPRLAGAHVLDDLAGLKPDYEALTNERAKEWNCIVLRERDDPSKEWLAAEDPWDEKLERRITRHLGRCPPLVAARRAAMQSWLGEWGGALQAGSAASMSAPMPDADGPVVAFVDQALRAAYESGASDVHFECDRAGVTAKHRIDGVMQRYARHDGAQRAVEVISRIKVMAQLDITERRLPQDGRLQAELGGHRVDVRVSIMPSVHGEDAVLRLLDKARLRQNETEVSLAGLGFGVAAAEAIRDLAMRPSGLFLVTGPTGSGKTTTVYAALAEIHDGLEKIITIEDPVEYELQGVLQIPVNERKGLTFARGLRSLLRHDPDRILVGEIRDAETAEIAVQSALTGHLVFTTVHANSVADVVARFRHFGLDMFGFMSALNGVIVQRLVRRLCHHCFGWREATAAEAKWLSAQDRADVARVPVAVGCVHCHGTGFRGRTVLAEVHEIDDAWRDHVTAAQPLTHLRAMGAARGVVPLGALAAAQVAEGGTTAEEVRRVVGW